MKRGIQKALISLCCIAMLLGSLMVTVSARELAGDYNTESAYFPTISNYTWKALTEVVSTKQTAKYFVITVKAGEHTEQLFVSFPETGGFRLESLHELQRKEGLTTPAVSHTGLFEPKATTINYKKDGSGAVVMTGTDGTVVKYVQNGKSFQLQICESTGKRIIHIGSGQISFAYDNISGIVVRTMVEMPLVEKEGIYLGSAASRDTNQVGDTLSLTVTDSWNKPDYLYIANPLYHSNRGYSMWFNMPYMGKQDCGEDNPDKMTITFDSTTDIKLDVFFWAGTPLENLKKYTDITGRSGLSPTYSFGYWTGAAAVAYRNTSVKDPTKSDVSHVNIVNMLESYYDNYGFYPEVIGLEDNNEVQITQNYVKERGIVSMFWYHPSANMATTRDVYLVGTEQFPTFNAAGKMTWSGWPYPHDAWLLKKLGTYQFSDNWDYIDYSNPSAEQLVKVQIANKLAMGNQGAMIDYGEWAHTDGVYHTGLEATGEMHQLMSYYYGRTLNRVFTERFGNDYILYQRSGWSGSQQFAGNFLGDQKGDYDGLMDQVHMMIGLGAGGYNLYGGDLGGFTGKTQTSDLWNRWVPLGVFSPYFRKHGQALKFPATDFDALAAKSFGNYYYFRKNIVPTVEGAAINANKTSNPMVKGMLMAYPYQLPLADVDHQYLFCDDFLVSAVKNMDASSQQTALPKGSTWYDLYSYRAYKGGQIIQAEAPAATLPVFVKGGAVKAINLPESMKLGEKMYDDSGDEYQAMPALLVTPPDDERETTIYVKDGESTDYHTYDSHTEVYTSTPDGSAFTIKNEDGSPREIMLALGVTAAKVTVDGVALSYLDHTPDYLSSEYGFAVDRQGMTTIYTAADWKEITITKGDAGYTPLNLTPISDRSMVTMLDDDPSTAYVVPRSSRGDIVLELDDTTDIGRVVVKWTAGFCDNYDIEYSEDGENWWLLLPQDDSMHTVEDGCGSVDIVDFSAVSAKYLRFLPGDRGDNYSQPAIYEFSVYGPNTFEPLDVLEPEEENVGDEDEDWDDDEWNDWEDDKQEDEDKQDEQTSSTRKKIIRISYFPWWLIVIIVVGGLAIIGGILWLILFLRKKKKKEAEAAVEADDAPTDFPEV